MTEFMQIKNNNNDYFFIKKVDDDSYEIITQFSHHEASNYQIIVSSYDGVIGGSLDFLESFLARNRFSDKEIEKIVDELLEIVDVSDQGLETLEVPEGIKEVYCDGNKLTTLNLPKGVEGVNCSDNNLTTLNLPEGVEGVYCYDNYLTTLNLPEGIRWVDCSNNNLKTLNIPEGVEKVFCHDNNFSKEEKARIIRECEERGVELSI